MSGSPVVPKHALGQHFLVDPNILRVIERLAVLGEDDIVLEIGPGLGALTTFLADRVAHVLAIEIDRSLEPRLRQALSGRENVRLVFGDALRIQLDSLDPAPSKLVSNLPYSVAAPVVVESIERIPTIDEWCVMVQREVADRFFARPGTKAYGAVSVLVQLGVERTGFHAVARTAFRPQPRVDSALVAFRRRPLPADWPRVKRIVEGAFAHRRKTLPNSLELAGVADRETAAGALGALGREAATRAEALAPGDFVRFAKLLE